MKFNISPLTKEQWGKVRTVIPFAFFSTFLGVFVTAGGITTDKDANIAMILSAVVAGINAAAYAFYQYVFVGESK